MKFRFFQKNKLVNIVIKDYEIRVLQTNKENAFEQPIYHTIALKRGIVEKGRIKDYVKLQAILQKHLKEWKMQKQLVHFTVPDDLVVLKEVILPFEMDKNEEKEYILQELKDDIPFEDPMIDYFYKGEMEEEKKAIVFATPEKELIDYVALLEETNLKPIGASVSSIALYRLFYHLDLAGDGVFMLMNIDLEGVQIATFEKHQPVFLKFLSFYKWMEYWKNEENGFIWKGTDSEFNDYMNRLIEGLISVYTSSETTLQKKINGVLISGHHPAFSSLQKKIQQALHVKVSHIQKDALFLHDRVGVPESGYVPFGLALREVHL